MYYFTIILILNIRERERKRENAIMHYLMILLNYVYIMKI